MPALLVGLAAGGELERLLVGQVQHDRDVVRAERPERVLVGAQLPEVEPVGVDVVDVAELAGGRDLLELGHARVVLEQVADHQGPARPLGGGDGPLGLLDGLRERLLDEAVLARVEHALGQRAVGRHRRGEHDRVERVVGQQVVEVRGEAGAGEARRPALAGGLGGVAAPRQLAARDAREVAGEVRAPVAEAGDADPQASCDRPPARAAPAAPGRPARRPGRRRTAAGARPAARAPAPPARPPRRARRARSSPSARSPPTPSGRGASRTARRPGRPPSARRRSRSARRARAAAAR